MHCFIQFWDDSVQNEGHWVSVAWSQLGTLHETLTHNHIHPSWPMPLFGGHSTGHPWSLFVGARPNGSCIGVDEILSENPSLHEIVMLEKKNTTGYNNIARCTLPHGRVCASSLFSRGPGSIQSIPVPALFIFKSVGEEVPDHACFLTFFFFLDRLIAGIAGIFVD